MLLNITYIDDLPEVRAKLEEAAQLLDCEYRELVNACLNDLDAFADQLTTIFCNPNKISFRFDEAFFNRYRKLKTICTASTGTVHVDLAAAAKHDVKVISIKTEMAVLRSVTSTADLALTLALTGIRKSFKSSHEFFDLGHWNFEDYIGKQIKDLNVCVFGYGRLGKMFAKYLMDLGAKVEIIDPKICFDFSEVLEATYPRLSAFDLISLHVHAEGNFNFFSDKFFAHLKDDVVIVNTARGEIIDQNICFEFLREHPNAFYLTDVIADEHSEKARNAFAEFYKEHGNLIVTQHIGGMSTGARKLAFGKAAEKLLDELK